MTVRARTRPGYHVETVRKSFGSCEEAVWAGFEPRRMQTRKEVKKMHTAITRARVMYVILAAVAAIILSLGLAPVGPAVMPLPTCPPFC